MVHLFNSLIILLFFMVLALFSNSEVRKQDEVFIDALQSAHTDSLRISETKEPVDSPHFIADKQ
ncbi:hypothetical protein [Sphingobacterium sp.]|uniref:hypothetical protein n=1 Tax=Sphingobacterium sp. TaxID=341027 RepID=UPI0031DA8C81